MRRTAFILSLLLLTLCQGVQAQENRRPRLNKEEFQKHVQELITKKAKLSDKEAKAFFPIFNEYKDKQRELHRAVDQLKNKAMHNASEEEYRQLVMAITQENAKFAQLDQEYYPRLCKAITAKKFYQILRVEDKMARRILQNYNQQHRPEQPKGPASKSKGNYGNKGNSCKQK